MLPVLSKQDECRHLDPTGDLLKGIRHRCGRIINFRVRDDGKKRVNTGPRNGPQLAGFGQTGVRSVDVPGRLTLISSSPRKRIFGHPSGFPKHHALHTICCALVDQQIAFAGRAHVPDDAGMDIS